MTIKYRNSGLHNGFSDDSFYKKHKINFGIDTSDENFYNGPQKLDKKIEKSRYNIS